MHAFRQLRSTVPCGATATRLERGGYDAESDSELLMEIHERVRLTKGELHEKLRELIAAAEAMPEADATGTRRLGSILAAVARFSVDAA